MIVHIQPVDGHPPRDLREDFGDDVLVRLVTADVGGHGEPEDTGFGQLAQVVGCMRRSRSVSGARARNRSTSALTCASTPSAVRGAGDGRL